MSFFSKIINMFNDKKYRANPNASMLSFKQSVGLNLGAINAEQTCCYCDSLETGLDTKGLLNDLRNYYGIVSRETALETLEWLLDRGHSIIFEAIKDENSFTLDDEETEKLGVFRNNINEVTERLSDQNYIASKDDFLKKSIKAWDLGRLVFVTRCCFQCGYVSEAEAWDYIEKARKAALSIFNNWNDFANSYVVGRAVAFGHNMMLGGIMDIAADLLKDAESPWKKYDLK
jgi:hypothetical protein